MKAIPLSGDKNLTLSLFYSLSLEVNHGSAFYYHTAFFSLIYTWKLQHSSVSLVSLSLRSFFLFKYSEGVHNLVSGLKITQKNLTGFECISLPRISECLFNVKLQQNSHGSRAGACICF